MYEVKDLVLAGTIAMIKHTILQGQNTCLNAKVHQVNSRLADGSQDPVAVRLLKEEIGPCAILHSK